MNLSQIQLSLVFLGDRSKDYHKERGIVLILKATINGDSNLVVSGGLYFLGRYGNLKEIPIWNLKDLKETLLPFWDLMEERIKDFGILFVMVISWFLYDYFWVDFQRIDYFLFSYVLCNKEYWMCLFIQRRLGSISRDCDSYGFCRISYDTDEWSRLSVRVVYGYKMFWVDFLGFDRRLIWLKIDFFDIKMDCN